MESRFGHDFSAVRLHIGSQADQSARAVGASAYTVGSHIVVGEGFAANSPAGQRLLAHELAHVVQQEHTTPSIQGATSVLDADDPLEREADTVADRVASGSSVDIAGRLADQVVLRQPAASGPASLEFRLAAFQRLVKNAGKLRMTQNSHALEQWRQFLQEQLTPAQVESQVHAEEVRSLVDRANQLGSAETAVLEQWLGTSGPNRRWVLQQQLEGRYRACTGCHAAIQADIIDRGLLEQRGQLRTPLEQLATGPDQGPRPSFAPGEQTAVIRQPGVYPRVAEAQARINAIRPYLRELGPERYQVLPPETLGSNAPPSELMADITSRISRRLADYQEFSRRIDASDFDYLQLRPLVRDLLPLADPDVRQAVQDAIRAAERREKIESIVVGGATIALLLLAVFPPTSAIGVAGALALAGAVGAHQIYRGVQEYEQGHLYSLARGTQGVLDPGQIEAADSLMAIGALNIVLGSIGVATSALGAVRLIRAAAPPGGRGLGSLETVEGSAGDNVVRVTGWGTRNPRVVVTGPNGQVIRDGPLSSFRPSASGAPPAGSSAGTGGGSIYLTEGGAARVAQPIPEPTPAVAPQPVIPPVSPPNAPLPPDVRALLATAGLTSAVGTVASKSQPTPSPAPEPKPKPREDEEQRGRCRLVHRAVGRGDDPLADLFCSIVAPFGRSYDIYSPVGVAEIDALAGRTWYECKCGYLSLIRALERGEFWARAALDRFDEQIRRQNRIATYCGYLYRLVVSNRRVEEFLRARHPDIMILVVEFEPCS
jgi:hypothetical protein